MPQASSPLGGKLSTNPLYGGGYHTFATIEMAYNLVGRPKHEQVRAICELHNLSCPAVMVAKRFEVEKSRNLPYHPATYILTVIHNHRNELRK